MYSSVPAVIFLAHSFSLLSSAIFSLVFRQWLSKSFHLNGRNHPLLSLIFASGDQPKYWPSPESDFSFSEADSLVFADPVSFLSWLKVIFLFVNCFFFHFMYLYFYFPMLSTCYSFFSMAKGNQRNYCYHRQPALRRRQFLFDHCFEHLLAS